MRVAVSPEAVAFITERGGRLFVWPKASRCCGGTWLCASLRPSRRVAFARQDAVAAFELYLPAAIARLPNELQLELRRLPARVEAYWDGCAWIV